MLEWVNRVEDEQVMSFAHDLFLISPLVILSLGALTILMLEVFLQPTWPRALVTGVFLILAGISLQWSMPAVDSAGALFSRTVFGGLVYADPFTSFVTVLLICGALLALLLGLERLSAQGVEATGEFYALYLFSLAGAILFVSSAELITLFMGLEIMSMALYCLCGAALRSKRSGESALKYFLLGSFSSAFLMYGIALLYGLTGTTFIAGVSSAIGQVQSPLLYFAMGLVLIGLVFKIGAVPFHFWAPDVYQGAPTSITAYMACVIKLAAFGAALRVLWVAFNHVSAFWLGAVWMMAFVTMTLGNLVAVRQRNVKRMLAYSSIAHAGYLMIAFLVPGDVVSGGAAILFYFVAYTLMTMGAFGVLLVVDSETKGQGTEHLDSSARDDITRLHGLGNRRPVLALLMSLFMLSLAGIPPGFAGFLGKFYIFGAALKANYVGIVVLAVMNSAVSCYYYLRVIVAMYFLEPSAENRDERVVPQLDLSMASALAVCAIGIIFIGLFPSALYDSAAAVMQSFQ